MYRPMPRPVALQSPCLPRFPRMDRVGVTTHGKFEASSRSHVASASADEDGPDCSVTGRAVESGDSVAALHMVLWHLMILLLREGGREQESWGQD